jgi:hypothetical protein
VKFGVLNLIKIFCICALLIFVSDSSEQKQIKIGEVTNEIRLGPFAGKRNMAVGVKNILEELLQNADYELTPTAEDEITIRLVFFDVKNIGKNIGIYHKDESIAEIIAIGELRRNGKVIKKTTQKGQSSEISTSTLIVAEDGSFNQQTASIALKKVCESIVKDLTK